jgi:hypothetical protein
MLSMDPLSHPHFPNGRERVPRSVTFSLRVRQLLAFLPISSPPLLGTGPGRRWDGFYPQTDQCLRAWDGWDGFWRGYATLPPLPS